MARRFLDYCEMFDQNFIVRGKDVIRHARHYLTGLLGTVRRKNIERIEADVAGSDYENPHQSISDSPWDDTAVLAQMAVAVETKLGGQACTAPYVDEISFTKKGTASVAVQPQCCGRIGKVDNCQVGVVLALFRGPSATLVDFRLFLPAEWANDPARCEKARVPEAHRVHRTKPELALAMMVAVPARGSTRRWVGADKVYGNSRAFTDGLDDLGEIFPVDRAGKTNVWTSAPCAPSPATDGGLRDGVRQPATPKASGSAAVRVDRLTAARFAEEARAVTIRAATKVPREARVWVCPFWVSDRKTPDTRARLLVVRQDDDGTFKYSLSNAAANTTWERLAYMQARRFWIERGFQDAKIELGLAQYEACGWIGWHHHVTLVCLALLFTLKERGLARQDTPLLGARDIVELLAYYSPRWPRSKAEVLRQMQHRHAARQRDLLNRRGRSHSARRKKPIQVYQWRNTSGVRVSKSLFHLLSERITKSQTIQFHLSQIQYVVL